jgi:stearoyl-CoA desaturase (delta-9 desaturase)
LDFAPIKRKQPLKERPIPTATSPLAAPGILTPRPQQQKTPQGSSLGHYFKTLPFIGLHVACIAVLFLPDLGITWTTIGLCFFTYFIRIFGITGVYHRYFSHRAYKTSRPMQFLLAWLGCSALQKGPLWWASHHRDHHRFSDTPDDPHSPREKSFWWAHIGWILSEEHLDTDFDKIRDFECYPELRWLDRNYWVPGILLAVACYVFGAVVGGWDGSLATFFTQPSGWVHLLWGFVISTVICYHATFSINSLSHLIGTRRYATTDDSRNNLFLALITLGEGWHNNHHHFQSSANQGFFWWEVDISYYIIRTMALFGLVWDIRKPGQKALAFRNMDIKQPQSV